MYQDLKLPVVPMALNSGLFWPKGSFLKKKGTVTIQFLPAIPVGLSRSAMMRQLEEQLSGIYAGDDGKEQSYGRREESRREEVIIFK